MSTCKLLPLLGILALTMSSQAQAPTVSPEVHPDRTVTFRLRAPNASKVQVGIEGSDAVDMSKGADGVWTYTTAPLAPDYYGYTFSADGVTLLDPSNPETKPNLIWPSNMVRVPGSPPELWETQDVPRGTLHHHFYHSGVIGDNRDFYVYTPPGYDPRGRARYPVLYLLHGYSDMANGWTSVGMAHVILDNLIAAKKAKPMLVVMTLGYGVPDFASPNRGFRDPGIVKKNYTNYRDALFAEVIPTIEKEYKVLGDHDHRAIAGLSMGGAESLFVGLNDLDRFAYVGAFSSGGLSGEFEKVFPSLTANANGKLKQLWISCGTEDGLIAFNRDLKKWLTAKGVKFTDVETPGRHAWMVWRRNLAAFAPLLFR